MPNKQFFIFGLIYSLLALHLGNNFLLPDPFNSVQLFFVLVWVEALSPSQQFFSHVGTEPPLLGYYQYFLGGKCILLNDTTRRPE